MAEAIYILSFLASVLCVVLLWRGWRRSAARLLLWTAVCFVGFAVNNAVLLLDETLWKDVADLRWLRHGSALAGCLALLGALIWGLRGAAMTGVLAGGTAVACFAIGLFFLRFWRDTRDRLFLAFAAAFGAFALNRVLLGVLDRDHEARVAVYSLRAAAFLLVVAAIVDRNRR